MTDIEKLTVEEAESATGWLGLPAGILEYPGVSASTKFVVLLVYSAPGHTPIEYATWQDITEEAVKAGLNDAITYGMIEARDGKAYPVAMTVTVEDDEE